MFRHATGPLPANAPPVQTITLAPGFSEGAVAVGKRSASAVSRPEITWRPGIGDFEAVSEASTPTV
ncbi:hypothetical protein [Nocardia sp. NPDC059239]|uniref:hypothetical protein n=1 Tax=unclassified Nocardia TaxID=2637762 RepID=UPI00369656F8